MNKKTRMQRIYFISKDEKISFSTTGIYINGY